MSPLFIYLTISENINEVLESIKEQTGHLKRSFRPFALYYLAKIVGQMPPLIFTMVANHASGQTTATFSNVAGPKTPLNYMGKECKKMAVLPPGAGLISCGISIISIGDTVKISMLVDEAICDNP